MVAGLPALQVFISSTMMLRVFELRIPSCHRKHPELSCSHRDLTKCVRVVINITSHVTKTATAKGVKSRKMEIFDAFC